MNILILLYFHFPIFTFHSSMTHHLLLISLPLHSMSVIAVLKSAISDYDLVSLGQLKGFLRGKFFAW